VEIYNYTSFRWQLYDNSKTLPTSTYPLIVPAFHRFSRKLAEYTGELPDDFYLSGSIQISQDRKQGGYADVTRGIFNGNSVAIKLLRGYNMINSDIKREKWKKVGSPHIFPAYNPATVINRTSYKSASFFDSSRTRILSPFSGLQGPTIQISVVFHRLRPRFQAWSLHGWNTATCLTS
jgi:hypothetical protein